MSAEASVRVTSVEPYAPRLLLSWLSEHPAEAHHRIDGSLVFVDVSGFTALSERLARRGKVGAEDVAGTIGACFQRLLGVAYANDGILLKFGGDALLLFFSGSSHQSRALRAAVGMRRALREVGPLPAHGLRVTLRMSVGVHAGEFDFFLVGESHRELVITGPGATRAVEMESVADPGEIVISPELAATLPRGLLGPAKGPGHLLRREPRGLDGNSSSPSPRVSPQTLAQAVPVGIRSHLLEGTGESEHRRVTVAFLHFDGTDELIERRGAAAAAVPLQELVARVQRAIDRRGVTFLGTDIDRDGGKIILAAGAPQATERDEERMLLALREIIEGEGALPIRIGCHRGRVFAGDIGPPYRRTYTVMGDAVNLAARLMAAARPGQIVVTPDVPAGSPTRFELAPLEPLTVKGKARPVHAHLLGPAQAVSAPSDETDELPFVGRETEMAELLDALAAARAGRGRVIEVVGDAGIGKSRLARELRNRAGPATVVAAMCELYEAGTAYFPFRSALRALLGLPEGGPDAAARLRSAVARLNPEALPWVPLIGIVVGVEAAPTTEVEELAEEFRRPQLERAIIDVLGAATEGALVLTIEDAHWMDEASVDLLRRIVAEAAERPWLVLVTRRDVEGGFAAPEAAHIRTLRPRPLGGDAATALVHAATEETPLAPHEVAALTDRAGGNPLFLRELVAMARAGALEEMPQTVEAAVTARIDQLAAEDRSILRRLAVVGETVAEDLLSAVLPDDQAGPDLDTWVRLEGFITRTGPGLLRFDHALIRDAAYEGLPYRTRRELHARVAETIERASFPDLDEHAEVLALHYASAGRHDAAWIHARMAAGRARDLYANSDAASFFERALEASRHVQDIPDDLRSELQEGLGDVRERLGEYDRASAAYRSARRLVAGDLVAEARLMLKQGWVRDRSGRFAEALRWIRRGLRLIDGVSGEAAGRQRAQLTVWYAAVRQAQGRHREAIRWARQAIAEAEAARESQALAHAYYLLDWALVDVGRPDEAGYSEAALGIYRDLGDLAGQATVLNNMAGFAYLRARWSEAVERYREARDASMRAGDPVNAAVPAAGLAEILLERGDLPGAEELLEEALRVWRASGHWWGMAYARLNLGRIASRRGELDRAEALLGEAREGFRRGGAASFVSEVDARLAEVRLLGGRGDEALVLADRLLRDESAEGGSATHGPLLHRLRGYALAQAGDFEAAERALEQSLELARQSEAEHEIAATLLAVVEVARLRGIAPPEDAGPQAREILTRLGIASRPPSPVANRLPPVSV